VLNTVDEAERDRLLAEVATDAAELAATIRRERNRRRAAGEDVAWFDHVLHDLDPLAVRTHDLEVLRAIRAATERHGPGPWPPEELATIAGCDVGSVRRVLSQMVADGLATPPPDTGEPGSVPG
jgi:hypothetical protein